MRANECRCVLSFCFCVVSIISLVCGCSSGSAPKPAPAVSVSVSPQAAAVGTGQTVSFVATVANGLSGVTWAASEGTIDADGNFVAPTGTESATVTIAAISKDDATKSALATVNVVAPGQMTATANVQVASYAISPAAAGNVLVQFGLDTNYGRTTWAQPVPSGGGLVTLFVAGMKLNALYHMRGVVRFNDGTQYVDPDMTFTTGTDPAGQLPVLAASTTPGMTPQSGVELLDLIQGTATGPPVAVADLNGDVLWSYTTNAGGPPNPIKLLPNGHFLINFSAQPDGINSVLQEVDLSGTVFWQMSASDLNNALGAATCSGCNITVVGTHHDFVILPNGHLIVIASINNTQVVPAITVMGDVIIDLDQNHNPVWIWNAFNHLDVTRQPMGFPDWTHTNAVLYSPDDGNLIISMRHQNWLIKIDYANGNGTGDVLWKLGYQGDFALVGGTDPTDWFYAQHGPSFTSRNTTGKFSLILFDNVQ